jgi:hypothetical protein
MVPPQGPAQAQGSGRDLAIVLDRDRIAAGLQHEVIQRIFAIDVSLESAAAVSEDRLVRRRGGQAITDIDEVVRVIRDTVFDRKGRPSKDRGLAAGFVHLCGQLSPVPAVSFHRAVNGAPRSGAAGLLDVLGDFLAVTGKHWAPVRLMFPPATARMSP